MPRLDQVRQAENEPARIEYAKEKLTKNGFEITFEDKHKIQFVFKNETVTLYPYSGWHTGKSIEDGRGLSLLLKQLN